MFWSSELYYFKEDYGIVSVSVALFVFLVSFFPLENISRPVMYPQTQDGIQKSFQIWCA